jgi:hypothetical protein
MKPIVLSALMLAAAASGETPRGAAPAAGLLEVRRIHVERLSGGETAEQIRDMIIAALLKTGLFALTEDPERADAVLRGSAEDLVFTETHESREGIDARGTLSLGSSSGSSRSARKGGVYASSTVGENESSRSVERRHEAVAAVRLVNAEGEILWSTVQESRGAKFRGASADVADKITRQIVKDCESLRRKDQGPPAMDPPRPPAPGR